MTFAANAEILGVATLSVNGGIIRSANAVFSSTAILAADGHIQGNNWTTVPFGTNTWTIETVGTNTWTTVPTGTNTWSRKG